MSVAECQRRVSSREFATWIALAQVEPWHDTEYRAGAIIAATIANAFQVFSKRKKEMKPSDFMPQWEESVYPDSYVSADADYSKPEGDPDLLYAKSMSVFMRFGLKPETKPN